MDRESYVEILRRLHDPEKVRIVSHFKEKLTPEWLEEYALDFFRSGEYGFQTFRNGWFDDRGVDVKGCRVEDDGSKTYLVVQCKRWNREHIQKRHLAEFYGDVSDYRKHGRLFLVFIATTWVTKNAWEFARTRDLEFCVIDYKRLVEMNGELEILAWIEAKIAEHGIAHCEKWFTPWYFRDRERLESAVEDQKTRLVEQTKLGIVSRMFFGG